MNFPACTTLLCGIVILVAVVGPVAAAGASDGVMTRLTRITFTGSEAPLMDGLATVMVIIIFAGSLINVVDFVKRFTVGARVGNQKITDAVVWPFTPEELVDQAQKARSTMEGLAKSWSLDHPQQDHVHQFMLVAKTFIEVQVAIGSQFAVKQIADLREHLAETIGAGFDRVNDHLKLIHGQAERAEAGMIRLEDKVERLETRMTAVETEAKETRVVVEEMRNAMDDMSIEMLAASSGISDLKAMFTVLSVHTGLNMFLE